MLNIMKAELMCFIMIVLLCIIVLIQRTSLTTERVMQAYAMQQIAVDIKVRSDNDD